MTSYNTRFLIKKTRVTTVNNCVGNFMTASVQAATCSTDPSNVVDGKYMNGGFRDNMLESRKKLRVICAPSRDLKARQKVFLKRLAFIPVHGRSYGFVRGRNSFDCAQSHCLYWGSQPRGLVFLNMDLENFFHSISEAEIRKALKAHKMSDAEVEDAINLCMARISPEFLGRVVESALRDFKRFPGLSMRRNSLGIISANLDALSPEILKFPANQQFPHNLLDPKWGLVRAPYAARSNNRTTKDSDQLVIKSVGAMIQARCQPGAFPAAAWADIYVQTTTTGIKRLFPTAITKWDATRDPEVVSKFIMELFMGVPNGVIGSRFLPQGAPTSPAISNIVMKIADIRLEALAKAFGAYYTRYADDLTFSWPYFQKGKVVDGLKRCATEVVAEYGLSPNSSKVKVMGPGQKQDVVGYNVNSGTPTVSSRYRKSVHNQVTYSLANGKKDHFERLMGMAGHIGSAHPVEAEALKERIRGLAFRHDMGRIIAIDSSPEATVAEEEESALSNHPLMVSNRFSLPNTITDSDTEITDEEQQSDEAFPDRVLGER